MIVVILCRGVFFFFAGVAQLVEQLICNQWVTGSIPVAGSLNEALVEIG